MLIYAFIEKTLLTSRTQNFYFFKTGTFVIAFNQMLQIGLIINDLFAP
jgi:hypothetical protein